MNHELLAILPPDSAPLDVILRPDWAGREKCHDWRNHIPRSIRQIWASLSEDARVLAYLLAERQADAELWD